MIKFYDVPSPVKSITEEIGNNPALIGVVVAGVIIIAVAIFMIIRHKKQAI